MLNPIVVPNPPPLKREELERTADGFFTPTGLTLTFPGQKFPTEKALLDELGLPDEAIAGWAKEDDLWLVRVMPGTQFPPHVFVGYGYPVPPEPQSE